MTTLSIKLAFLVILSIVNTYAAPQWFYGPYGYFGYNHHHNNHHHHNGYAIGHHHYGYGPHGWGYYHHQHNHHGYYG